MYAVCQPYLRFTSVETTCRTEPLDRTFAFFQSALYRSLLIPGTRLTRTQAPYAVQGLTVDAMADDKMQLAVCGLHMRGQKLEHQLTDLGGTFLKACKSGPVYEMFAITDPSNKTCKPGMIAVGTAKGRAIEMEVWKLPVDNLGRFFLQVPPPLGLGTVCLEDGSSVKGFICEGYVANLDSHDCSTSTMQSDLAVENITQHASWKQYQSQQH